MIRKETKELKPATIPDGEYVGVWHAYSIRWNHEDSVYQAETENGVRGWTAVKFSVKDNDVVQETVKALEIMVPAVPDDLYRWMKHIAEVDKL